MTESLKAYSADTGDDWRLLVYAKNRNQARRIVADFVGGTHYIDTHAVRVPGMDGYALRDEPHYIDTNDELPEGVRYYTGDYD